MFLTTMAVIALLAMIIIHALHVGIVKKPSLSLSGLLKLHKVSPFTADWRVT